MKTLKILMLAMLLVPVMSWGQTPVYNAAYVHALYAKYPVQKSNLCANCNIWANPFFTSIADTKRHMPICEHAIVTQAHRILQEQLEAKVGQKNFRKGTSAAWFVVGDDVAIDNAYSAINKAIAAKYGKPGTVNEIAYGHCGLCWILAAWCYDGMFFSDSEDYNEGAQVQGQNVGTQIASEDTTRALIGAAGTGYANVKAVDQVEIWGGCYAGPKAQTFTDGKGVTVTIPDAYWKILKFGNQTVVYWMPNLVTEVKSLLPQRHITYQQLVKNIGFDPEKVLS